jgi:hypothetical protein
MPSENVARPPFMVTLGLLPPYSLEDVHEAYRTRAKTTHPDRGGDAVQFEQLHEAYVRALEYVRFHGSRRRWIGARVEDYVRREALIAEVQRRGGHVDVEANAWIREDLGEEFAQFVDKVVGIHWHGPQVDDEALAYLADERSSLQTLRVLDLADSRVTDRGLVRLKVLTSIRRLDLRGTAVTHRGLRELLSHVPLRWLNVRGTAVGWLGRQRLRWRFPEVKVVSQKGANASQEAPADKSAE